MVLRLASRKFEISIEEKNREKKKKTKNTIKELKFDSHLSLTKNYEHDFTLRSKTDLEANETV